MPTSNGATNPKNAPVRTGHRSITLLWHPNQQKESLSVGNRLKAIAQDLAISKAAKLRLDWIIYYLEHDRNASLTARHFGISRKTFHKWWNEFDEDDPRSMLKLADRSKAPEHVRQREITFQQERRVVELTRLINLLSLLSMKILWRRADG